MHTQCSMNPDDSEMLVSPQVGHTAFSLFIRYRVARIGDPPGVNAVDATRELNAREPDEQVPVAASTLEHATNPVERRVLQSRVAGGATVDPTEPRSQVPAARAAGRGTLRVY
jgi:hypothetical protein